MPAHIVLLDDHRIVLESFSYLLNTSQEFDVVGLAQNHDTFFAILEQQFATGERVDVAIVDLMMPENCGVDLIKTIKYRYPSVAILVLSGTSDPALIRQAIRSGADGFVTKTADKTEIFEAILAVTHGRRHIDSRVFMLEESTIDNGNKLTERELEIASLILDEFSSAQIAERLFISFNTVETHRKRIYQKLGIKTSLGLMKYSLKLGLLKA